MDIIGKEFKNGKYRIIECVGRGGFAWVFRSKQVSLDRDVAMKILLPKYANEAEVVARFHNEAMIMAMYNHPHIVSIFEHDKEENYHYIVMTFLESDLEKIIKEKGQLDLKFILKVTDEVLSALDYAHTKRNLKAHRDIKPSNIMFDSNGNSVLTDFGIARAALQPRLTAQNMVVGTAEYMSPEQSRGLPVSPQSDIYSLGVVMYEMATGRVPFQGADPISVAYKHVYEEPLPPSKLNPEINPKLEKIILKCLNKRIEDRYPDANSLRKEIQELILEVGLPSVTLLVSAVHRKKALLPEEEEKFNKHLERARKSIEEGDTALALTEYEEALIINPYNETVKSELRTLKQKIRKEGHLKNGKEYLKSNNLKEALFEYKSAFEIDPNDESIKLILEEIQNKISGKTITEKARSYLENGQIKEAVKLFFELLNSSREDPGKIKEELLKIEKNHKMEYYESLAEWNLEKGNQEDALLAYKSLIKLKENPKIREKINELEKQITINSMLKNARNYISKGWTKKALDEINRAIKINPDNEYLQLEKEKLVVAIKLQELIEKGQQELEKGFFDEAEKYLENAQELDSKDLRVQHFAEVLVRHKLVANHKKEAENYEKQKLYGLAFASYLLSLEIFPDDKEVNNKINSLKSRIKLNDLIKEGTYFAERGDIAKAHAIYRCAVYLFPNASEIKKLQEKVEQFPEESITEISQQKVSRVLVRKQRRTARKLIGAVLGLIITGGSAFLFTRLYLNQPEKAILSISTLPPSSSIFINDSLVGTSPWFSNKLNPGTYKIKLIKEGYETLRKEIYLREKEDLKLSLNIKKIFIEKESDYSSLHPVKSEEYKADTIKKEKTQKEKKKPTVKKEKKVEKEAKGIDTTRTEVKKEEPEGQQPVVTEEKYGFIMCNAFPPAGVSVFIDGFKRGGVPASYKVNAGKHTVYFIDKNGVKSPVKEVNVGPDEKVPVSWQF